MKHLPFPPKLLISMRNLRGGQYGTLDVTARDADTVELALGADYVWIGRPQWAALRAAIDPLFGLEIETVIVTRDEDGEPVVIEERERVAPGKRPPRPRKPRSNPTGM
jgi:hypothetical protein